MAGSTLQSAVFDAAADFARGVVGGSLFRRTFGGKTVRTPDSYFHREQAGMTGAALADQLVSRAIKTTVASQPFEFRTIVMRGTGARDLPQYIFLRDRVPHEDV